MSAVPTHRHRGMHVVTLLTDFGTADGYVGEMKGVLRRSRRTQRSSTSRTTSPPHDVEGARLALARYWRRFPEGTVHLVVVDPGVGERARARWPSASEGRFLVGPDNGVLSPALLHAGARCVSLADPARRRADLSRPRRVRAGRGAARAGRVARVARRRRGRIRWSGARRRRLRRDDGAVQGEVITRRPVRQRGDEPDRACAAAGRGRRASPLAAAPHLRRRGDGRARSRSSARAAWWRSRCATGAPRCWAVRGSGGAAANAEDEY